MMIYLIKRNLRLFFRDKASVFFSMLGVIIIIGLYVLFLGNMISSMVDHLPGMADSARFLMDSWIMGGVVAVASITTCMGAFGIMVDDRANHIIKDFMVAPVKRWQLVLSYIASSVIIGIIMSIFTFLLAEVYIIIYGGSFVSFTALIKILGLIILSVSASSALVFFITTFVRSQNAFGTASTILGTVIGFLTGIYIPIGSLPNAVQIAIKFFPVSHAAVLMRQIMMNEAVTLNHLPMEVKEALGVHFIAFDDVMPNWSHILVLIGTLLVFYSLALWAVSRKKGRI
ncbi:MAG: ABC transporter permease [Candidatus Izemoplasmatales bacterium]|jgi:multidrug/hemolysin transport system permease protein